MIVSKVFPRILRNGVRCFVSSKPEMLLYRSDAFDSLRQSSNLLNKLVPYQMVQFASHSIHGSVLSQRFWFSSSASPQPNEKEVNQLKEEQGASEDNDKTSQNISQDEKNTNTVETGENGKASKHAEGSGSNAEPDLSKSQSVRKRRRGTKRTAFSDSDAEEELSFDDLVKLVAEKEELLKAKHKEVEILQEKVLRGYADMENTIERTKREAENAKKFAIQNFAKSLLDVADNLGRASSVVKESFSKIDSSKDSTGAVPLLKTLLEGVEMTEKQLIEHESQVQLELSQSKKLSLSEVFRKYGVEKYYPLNEQFDPHRHYAVFQIPDASKPPGTVAAVLKVGYMLYDRVIRPAEVGVTDAVNGESQQSSDT